MIQRAPIARQIGSIRSYVSKCAPQERPLTPEILHLYRALLRQVSYLPDSASRNYFRRYVPKAFRQSFEIQDLAEELQTKRIRSVTRNHESLLRSMCLADAGHIHHLSKILSLTYGRTGKRRHELLQELRASEKPLIPPVELEVIAKDSKPGRPLNRKSRPPTPLPPKVLALAKSQTNVNKDFLPFRNIKRIKPKMPETNVWGRPLPKCRERNINRAMNKEILSRLMPPLSEQEWKTLGELSKGERKWEGRVLRRAQAMPPSPNEYDRKIEKWIAHSMGEVQELSGRMMRNLWEKTWRQCPLITDSHNASSSPWKVTWGRTVKGATLLTDRDGNAASPIFAGVDAMGRIHKPRGGLQGKSALDASTEG